MNALADCFEFAYGQPRLRLVDDPGSPLTFSRAIDAYEGELARRGKSASTRRSYRRNLVHFARMVRDKPPAQLTIADYERFTDRWVDRKPSTLASIVSLAHGFSTYLYEKGVTDVDVAAPLKRPRRQRPEDTDVITVSGSDVRAMLGACEDLQELVCLASAIYLGARRAALARMRRSDVDLVNGTVRLLEKGGKVNVKPLPDEYQALLIAAERDGLWQSPDDYLIPNRRPASVKRSQRSDKIVWETVKRVAKRAGVRSHVHALRAAFAVAFDEAHPDQVIALQELLGHTRIETTLVYLRRKDRAKAMEQVRDLSWGLPKGEGHAGRSSRGDATSDRQAANNHRAGRMAQRHGEAGSQHPPSDPFAQGAESPYGPELQSLSVPSSQPLEAHTGFEPVLATETLVEPLLRRLRELTTAATGDVPSS